MELRLFDLMGPRKSHGLFKDVLFVVVEAEDKGSDDLDALFPDPFQVFAGTPDLQAVDGFVQAGRDPGLRSTYMAQQWLFLRSFR